MADILSLEKPSSGILSLEQWQPPMQYPSQVVEAAKAEDNLLLTPEYKAQNEVYNEVIESAPLDVVGFEGLLSDMQANGQDTASAATALADIADKNAEFNRLMQKGAALSYVDVQNAKDPTITANQFRIQYRAGMTAQRLTELAEQFTGGNGDAVLEALDSFSYSVLASIDMPEQYSKITGRGSELTAKSKEWLSAMATMSDDQFDQFVNEKVLDLNTPKGLIEGMGDSWYIPEGMSEQSWKVLIELQALEGMGYVQGDVESSQLGAMVDLATADFGSVIAAGRYGVKALSQIGKSAVYRTRNAFGTDAATAAAIKLTPNGVPTNPRVAEDILPTVFANPPRNVFAQPTAGRAALNSTTAQPNVMGPVRVANTPVGLATPPVGAMTPPGAGRVAAAVTPPPTVSQGALQANWIIKKFLVRQAEGAFGMAGVRDDALQWATIRAQSFSTNVIDVDVADDGILGTVATYTIGKEGGGSFTNFNNAKEVAAQIANSAVVSTKTNLPVTKATRGDTYAIRFAERRDYQATPMDISTLRDFGRLGDGMAKWFGSNGLQSNPFWNDLIYSADAGGAKFKHDIEGVLKSFDKFNPEEQGAFSSIITSIQDNGKRNTWYDTTEFAAQYASLTGKAPSEEVIQVYEDVVVASDAAWFIQADKELQNFSKTGVLVFNAKGKVRDTEHLIYPYNSTVSDKVMDGSTGAMVDASAVPQGAIIYKFMEGKQGRPRFVYNTVGRTRLPQHADALPYNAGGPRSNPHIQYFAGTMDGGWQTLIGAKTEKQVKATVAAYGKIQAVFSSLKKDVDLKNPLVNLSAAEVKLLDNVILANNKWNPNIESWVDLAKFLDGRGIDIRVPMVMKERNAKLEVFEDFGEDFVMRKNVGKYVQYSRHDEHLLEYGGERTYNPNPMQAINAQLNRSLDQAARIQWEKTHVESWAQAVHNAKNPKKTSQVLEIDGYSSMFTGSALAKSVTIKGNTELARALRREQSTIVRRLGALEGSTSESGIWRGVRNAPTVAANWALEAIYDSEWKWAEKLFTGTLRTLRDNTSGTLLSFGFMTKMASPMQFIMQGMSAVQIVARSPVNGFRGAFLAGYIREMASHKQGMQLLTALRKNLAKVGGLTDKQMDDLIEHFETSGRGFAKGVVVEDPQALPGISGAKTRVGKAVDFGVEKAANLARAPFYAGENYAQTVSRITAYLDTVKKFPSVNTKSKEFWGAVTSRDRSLSMNLNPGSGSMAQKDSTTAILTQWTSWSLRAIETTFFDKTLTLAERLSFAGSLTVLWGAAGMGLGGLVKGEDGDDSMFRELLKYGPIDTLLKETAGVTLGDRVGFNLPSLFARIGLTATTPGEAAPSVNIAYDAASRFMQSGADFYNGRPMLGAYELGRLVRTFKIVDDPYMAYTMLMEGERVTRSGQSLPANYTTTQVFFQALGLRPNQVTEFNNLKYSDLAKQNDRKFKAIDKAVPSLKMAMEYGNKGDWGNAHYYMEEAASIIDAYGLSPTYRAEAVQAATSKAGADLVSFTVLSAIRAGLGKDALNLAESLK